MDARDVLKFFFCVILTKTIHIYESQLNVAATTPPSDITVVSSSQLPDDLGYQNMLDNKIYNFTPSLSLSLSLSLSFSLSLSLSLSLQVIQ